MGRANRVAHDAAAGRRARGAALVTRDPMALAADATGRRRAVARHARALIIW
jgi:hypothetical protein